MPPRRSSGQPPQGSDPDGRDRWHEYDDEMTEEREWDEADVDPLDGRPLPGRRQRRGVRIWRALAWTGGAALLMVAGGALALVTWPRTPGPATTVAATPAAPDVAAALATAPREVDDASGTRAAGSPETARAAEPPDEARPPGPAASPADPATRIQPPPLPPLPPGLEVDTPRAMSSPAEIPATVPPPRSARPDASPPRAARSVVPPPASLPGPDTRSSEEIMGDFLVRSSGRAQAEATARGYAEWYGAGSAERTYWLGVLRAVRSRP